ncbi:MAG TPA: arsenate reductase ArsC [Burkholderiales bacterium]|nr:arsenate reductase ArsC [Burkholderiales bacterium]
MNVLFVCDDNCAVSLMAESILATVGNGRFHAYSAGCAPAGSASRPVIDFLADHNMHTGGLRPKALEAVRRGAPPMDFIITLCDAALGESFADWPGAPFVAHWNVHEEDDDPQSEATQREVFWTLWRRIKIFASLPQGTLNRRVLERRAVTLEASYL